MEHALPGPLDLSMRRYGFVAVVVSLTLHGCLVALLGWSESGPPKESKDLAPSTLAGTSFEVDVSSLLGASSSVDASEPSTPPVAASSASSVDAPDLVKAPSEASADPSASAPAPLAPRLAESKPEKRALQAVPPSSNRTSQAPIRGAEPKGAAPSSQAPSSEQQPGGARYGAAEGATRVSLARAFIKTLPLAAKLFPGWLELELGAQKPVLVELRLDTEGHLTAVEILRGDAKRLTAQSVQRNQVFLRSARFANDAKAPVALLFSVRAEVSMKPPSDELDSAEKVVALGQRFDASRPSEPPTGAYLTYGSGRHVEFEVSLVPSPP